MPALRPVSAEARLTLVEHLGELRTRLIVSIGILIVAFAFTYWQNSRVLDIVNEPLTKAQLTTDDCDRKVDPITSGECFDRAVSRALGSLQPLVAARSTSDDPAVVEQTRKATEALDRAVSLAPTGATRKPVTLGVAEPFFQTINVALYAALVLTLPLLLYQLYAFLIPAFTRRERQAIVPLLIGVPFLFYAGVAFGYFLALPRAVDFLQNFNADNFDILVQAKDYYKFVLMFLAGTGVVFQVPVLVIGLARLGVLTPKQMRKQRGMVALASAVIAAIITPTPDAVTMLMLMLPLIVLFEISVMIASLLERRNPVGGRPSRWSVGDDDGGGDDEPDDDDPYDPNPYDPEPYVGDGDGERDADQDDGTADDDWHEFEPQEPQPAGEVADDWGEVDDDAERDDDAWPPAPPVGEEPDPALQGDVRGPQVVGPIEPNSPAQGRDSGTHDWSDEASGEDWRDRADALDRDDPYAAGPDGEGEGDDSPNFGGRKE